MTEPQEYKLGKKTHESKGSPSVEVVTLGCRLNAYESDVITGHARDADLRDAVIVNSCAVTQAAVADTRRAIRKARRTRPEARIIVTGCAAQIDPESFINMEEVDHVMGNAEKMLPTSFLPDALERPSHITDIMTLRHIAPQLIDGANRQGGPSQSRTRAFLQIQNGCDHCCTFCIIPFGRGGARSVPAGEIVAHIRLLVDQGYREVVLTGVDISSWGGDLPGTPPLGDLVRRVLKLVPDLPRLRLSSIDPAEIDPVLFEALTTHPRMMPYLHLSLQAGDNMILKRMKRRHDREMAIDLCARLKAARPDITFGADMIAGFPTETEAMFENSLEIISETGIAWLHVFPFSARMGTPAAKMPPVAGSIIKARAARLREEGARVRDAHLQSRIGDEDVALFEETGLGRLPDFTTIYLDNPAPSRSLAKVRITGHDQGRAIGHLIG